jgi:hypothetical protein
MNLSLHELSLYRKDFSKQTSTFENNFVIETNLQFVNNDFV